MVMLYIVPCWIHQLALTSDVVSGFIFGLVSFTTALARTRSVAFHEVGEAAVICVAFHEVGEAAVICGGREC